MATLKSSLTTKVPAPKNQGGHGSAPVQPAKVQAKSGPAKTGSSTVVYSKQPSGTKGTGTNAGKPMK